MMLDFARAYVEDVKLSGYLLNVHHPDGGPKAQLFLHVGFRSDAPDELWQQLLDLARRGEAREVFDPFGIRYFVDGDISTPSGRPLRVRTVWRADAENDPPRLVTAYALDRPDPGT